MLLLVLKILPTHNVTIFTKHHSLCCINCPGVKRLYNNAVFRMAINFLHILLCLNVSIALLHAYIYAKNKKTPGQDSNPSPQSYTAWEPIA